MTPGFVDALPGNFGNKRDALSGAVPTNALTLVFGAQVEDRAYAVRQLIERSRRNTKSFHTCPKQFLRPAKVVQQTGTQADDIRKISRFAGEIGQGNPVPQNTAQI